MAKDTPTEKTSPAHKALLGATMLVSGASVMIYEFIAVRFLQRDYGSMLDIWASEIAVCMGGLALGYWLGGILADRYHTWRLLGKVLFMAGLLGLFMEQLARTMGGALAAQTPQWWHPLAAATICSFLPLLALGTALPQAIRLHASSVERVGHAAGWIAAMSTVGSILGVLATALILFPRFGIRETLWGVSGLLVAWGLGLILGGRFAEKVAVVAAGLLLLSASANAQPVEIFEDYGLYQHVQVVDYEGKRYVLIDNSTQSTMSLADPLEGGFDYTALFHIPVVLNPAAGRALFVGLGGGTGPKQFLHDYPEMQVDVVELDPLMVEVAREYFFMPEDPRLDVAIADGRRYLLRAAPETYDAIIVDAYAAGRFGSFVPYHLVTQEYLELIRSRLKPGGVMVYNVIHISGKKTSRMVASVRHTTEAVFSDVYLFHAELSGNAIIVARRAIPGDADLQEWPNGPWQGETLTAEGFQDLGRQLAESGQLKRPVVVERMGHFAPDGLRNAKGLLLTDNFAPVDVSSVRWGEAK